MWPAIGSRARRCAKNWKARCAGERLLADIFISYSRDDAEKVRAIAERLRLAGYDVWWDRKLGGGSFFAKEIEEQLLSAGAVIVVWSAASIASHWVVDEASSGRDAGKLVPISFDGTQPPLGFRQLHTIAFTDSDKDEGAFADLISAVDRQCERLWKSGAAPELPAPIMPAAALGATDAVRKSGGPRRLFVGAGLALAAIGLASILFLRSSSSAPVSGGVPSAGATIAVLPVRHADDPDAAAAERLTRELEASLTRAPWLTVEAARSVSDAAARAKDLAGMAAAMDVAYMVDSELQIGKDVARLSLQLTSPASGASVWSFSEEFPAARIGEPDFVEQIADAIWRNVYRAEAERARDARLESLAPRELLALALSGIRHAPWTEDGVREAVGVLTTAVSAHPDDAEVLATAAQADITLGLIDKGSAERLEEAAEERLAKAFLLDPQSRWVEAVAADVNFASGRYFPAAEGYDRLIRRGFVLPATHAREIDARARVSGAFASAALETEALTAKAFTPLQRSQTHAAAAYMNAAAGDVGEAFDHARSAVAAVPNNPDAVMALVMMATLASEDAALAESVRAFCNFYPSFDYPSPEESGALRAQLEGDGGDEWRTFIARLFEAYAARWPVIDAACE